MGYKPLPSDEYLAEMLGLTPAQMEWFQQEIDSKVKIDPGVPQAGLETLAIVSAGLSIGFNIAASFFKPKQGGGKNGGIKTQSPDPVNITRNQKFAPRRGFDSVQQPAILGTTTPVIYANQLYMLAQASPPRPEGRYGGVRVNMQLLWSQMLSSSGSQILKAIFMLGEGRICCIDPKSFAVGDNTLGTYDLDTAAAQAAGRLTLYYAGNGGRLRSTDYLAGRSPSTDIGNAENTGGADVFSIRSEGNAWRQDSCFTAKPSTQTTFGVYNIIPNNLGLRINPRIRPTINLWTKNRESKKKYEVRVNDDAVALADMWKSRYWWSGRSGIISTSTGSSVLNVGDTFVYMLSKTSAATTQIKFEASNTNNPPEAEPGIAKCTDIANTIASRQMSAADALSIGELYKVGSCLAVVTEISPSDKVFSSEVDNYPVRGGQSVYYTFTVVRSGIITIIPLSRVDNDDTDKIIYPPQWAKATNTRQQNLASYSNGTDYDTATSTAQIFRCAIANIQLNQRVKCFEIGIKSAVGIRASGLCNFKDAKRLDEVNYIAGYKYHETLHDPDKDIDTQNFQSGQLNDTAERYSFWRMSIVTEDGTRVVLPASIGIRSQSQQAIYNYIRVEQPVAATPQIELEPLTGWEIRNGLAVAPFIVLDGNISSSNTLNLGGYLITWSGTVVENTSDTFRLHSWEPNEDLGYKWTDTAGRDSMLDCWGKVAEAFVYEEVQTTAAQGPEHEITYVNVITANETTPKYDFLAIVGGVFRAATEWSQFAQFSVRVTGGRMVRRVLHSNSPGPSNLLPDIGYDLCRSSRLGLGQSVSDKQLDLESFYNTGLWLKKRRYFFDGVLTEKVNIRQWLADIGGTMLVDITEKNGRLAMEPAVVFPEDGTGKPPISGLYTAGNILPNSFSLTFIPEEDRQPIQASGKWREERSRASYTRNGVFPVEREVRLREADRPESDPIEVFDLSEYCTNFEQCVDALCYIVRLRRLITHSVQFSTRPSGILGGLYPGAYIRLALDYTYYDEFANGIVLNDGTLVTTRPDLLPEGNHTVTYWDGLSSALSEGTITVGTYGKASPAGIIFMKKTITSQVRTYKVDEVSINSNRDIDVKATHHPTDNDGYSLITKNWTSYVTDTNWIIQRG
jgi:hypothetical protein